MDNETGNAKPGKFKTWIKNHKGVAITAGIIIGAIVIYMIIRFYTSNSSGNTANTTNGTAQTGYQTGEGAAGGYNANGGYGGGGGSLASLYAELASLTSSINKLNRENTTENNEIKKLEKKKKKSSKSSAVREPAATTPAKKSIPVTHLTSHPAGTPAIRDVAHANRQQGTAIRATSTQAHASAKTSH
jgi:hypothetical protein